MNLDDDYDNDGNNIVPCPICLDVYCPSKEGGGCPTEDEYARDMMASTTPPEVRGIEEWSDEMQHAYDSILFNHNPIEVDKPFVSMLEDVLTKLLHQELQKALAVQAIQIREEEANEYNKIIEEEAQKAREEERERIEAVFKEHVPPHAMDLEDSVWLKRLLNKAFNHDKNV